MVPSGDPELIVDAKALEEFLAHAREHSAIAFDTEFIGEESFRPRICLVQLATTQRVALVDPFQVKKLDALWELVADRSILTIVHAGDQDVEAVRTAIGRQPERMVDTQVAASLAGFPWPTSLGTMIERLIGHRPAKAHTFTNWDARPLTPAQLRYAADDVRYLPLAWSLLDSALARRGRLEWAMRESAAVLEGDLVFDPTRQVRRAARGEPLRPAALTALRELVLLRHDLARRADLPPRAVIPDTVAIELVKRSPGSRTQLSAIRGLP
ncbi:MAG: ribonuclease D, partial [Phycisphaerae bacterium]|nr:ribonuclease D [Phycisphaerae bacterium]